ncbi:hypothetical protein PRIPAC_76170 [Pristionchus pacificus]|uniref:SAM-dependent MTase TRM10-type domain-containing protein n=1 Tax=Pristionchus pacificus TaxID=54126 RepID=A0A2A6C9N1_PRIPA|nr:hypothetical protein PRIPAC_76170 [Pristionchus pacificus]|eukprot:PDM74806.1 hypothetical protein PRIPAC_43219 [Pristionchus pacificus]
MLTRSIFGLIVSRVSRRRSFSVASYQSSQIEDSAPSTLPSRDFLKNNVRTSIEKDRLTSVISEIEMYKEFHGAESIPELSDKQWESLLTIKYPDERCNFLAALHYDMGNGDKQIKESEAGDTESNENQFIDLRGQDLRKQMDAMYGSRLWSDQRSNNDSLPRLIVDARFITDLSVKMQPVYTRSVQELHVSNWSSPHPFNISIANFRPDAQISELIKRHWLFLHGPPSESLNASSFRIHPFSPTVSPRPVRSILSGIDKDDILYVSQKAQRFLPEKAPSNIKAVVLCLSGDVGHSSSSCTAAVAERLTPYRIPIEKHINLSNSYSRSPPIWEMASALRGWFRGEEWRDTIKDNIIVRRKRISTLANGIKSETFLVSALVVSFQLIFGYKEGMFMS